jgi:acetyl esterase/lipase
MKKPRCFLRNHWKLLICIAFLLVSSGCITTALVIHRKLRNADFIEDWNDGDGTVLTNIVYDSEKNLKYDLYLPTSSAEKDTPVGAMLFIHGGAWKSGKKEDMMFACRRFAKQGYVTATMEYTLFKEGAKMSFFTILDDIGKCLEHLRDTAKANRHPIKAVALSGISAGGHLAMLYAYSRADNSPVPISFVFQQVGPSFFQQGAWPDHPDLSFGLTKAGAGIEMSREEYDSGIKFEAVKSISPALLVNEQTVPTIAAYGGKDPLVPTPHAEKLRKALEEYNVPHVFIIYPHSGHFLCEDPDCAKKYREAILDYCRKYFSQSK